jgi:hypothetical protein
LTRTIEPSVWIMNDAQPGPATTVFPKGSGSPGANARADVVAKLSSARKAPTKQRVNESKTRGLVFI